jgi:FAD/FMN-containing dehydrogenase
VDDMSATIELAGFAGGTYRPGDEGYDEARRIYNGLIDRRPALIARCTGVEDVAAAIAAGRAGGLELAIRGGGHSVAGRGTTDGGVMVDLSLLKAIDVDPDARTVRAGGGVNWGELNEATQAHGLAVTGGVISTTGIAGLTLGGGLGWLMPKHGLALDNLLSAEVVLADGRVVTASEEEHPDLFWALRGGGGNFGVVTTFEYRLHEVGPLVTGGRVFHPLDAARDLLRFFRELVATSPDELMSVCALVPAPDGSGAKLCGIAVCHVGPPEQAERDLAPLLAHGSPVLAQIEPMPYTALNAALDDGFPYGSLNYWKSGFLDELPDEAIDALVDGFARCESPLGKVIVEGVHGAVTRVPVDATACELRRFGFNCVLTNIWTDPATTDANIAWTRETYESFRPYASPLRYVNYFSADDDAALRAAYGTNFDRLSQVKRLYDPDNVFRLNANIPPA